MAEDREQKIRDVYEVMHRAHREKGGAINAYVIERIHRMARAAVDVLDPVKRIELSGGCYAVPGETPGHLHDVYRYKPGGHISGHESFHVGQLSKAAVEAWAEAAESHQTLNYRTPA